MKPLAKQVLEVTKLNIFENINAGYWISPSGNAFPVSSNHIVTVIADPEKFGYTREELESIHKKHKERLGQEGKAREEIILDLVAKGWIRVRSYRRGGDLTWSVNINRLTKRVKDHLTDFFQMLSKGTGYLGSEVYIDSPMGVETYSPQDIAKYALYNEGFKGPVTHKLRFVESVHAC